MTSIREVTPATSMPMDLSEIEWIEPVLAWFQTHQTLLAVVGALSLVVFIGSLVVIYLILIHLPQNYFIYIRSQSTAVPFADYPALRIVYLILKNILGGAFVLAGLAMLVLPGQGIISILIGLSLLSLPGKRHLVRRLVRMPSVLQTINRLRRRAGKPPLRAPE